MTPDHALVEAIREVAQIPTERRFWSARTIAAYLDYEETYIANTLAKREDFPRPAKIGGNGHPRWRAGDVMAWAEQWLPVSRSSAPVPPHQPGSRS